MVSIRPGEHFVTKDKLVISTLLGSCVAACLFDPTTGIAGMNHFLLANTRYTKSMPINNSDAGRYGIHAMELLINDMMKLGAQRNTLKAKVFGGGAVLDALEGDNFFCVGEVNTRFVHEFLETEHIEIVSQDLGGKLGRVIRFHTDTYAVYRRFIAKSVAHDLGQREHSFWKAEVEKQQKDQRPPIFFGN